MEGFIKAFGDFFFFGIAADPCRLSLAPAVLVACLSFNLNIKS